MQEPLTLELLPPEILLHILSFLSIPDLLPITRTSHRLRTLSLDPQLHLQRLHEVPQVLSATLPHRPSRNALCPPRSTILLTRTHVLARQLSRSLISARLTHNLAQRPSASTLVARAILPSECSTYSSRVAPALVQTRATLARHALRTRLGRALERRPDPAGLASRNILPAECVVVSPQRRRPLSQGSESGAAGGNVTLVVAPALIATRRRVMRESVKDGLRAWVEGRGLAAQKRKAREWDARLDEQGGRSVKALVRRFTAAWVDEDVVVVGPAGLGSGERSSVQARKPKVLQQKREAGSLHLQQQLTLNQRHWGREAELDRRREARGAAGGAACGQPTRAHVLGLRRFWEGVGAGPTP